MAKAKHERNERVAIPRQTVKKMSVKKLYHLD